MTDDASLPINERFTKRYLLAILLIAFLSSGAFLMLQFSLKSSDSTALIVNLSGKQRMLSQRLASLSQRYYASSFVSSTQGSDSSHIKISLVSLIKEMRLTNESLSSGFLTPTVTVKLSTPIHELYFGQRALKQRVEVYLALAETLLSSSSQAESSSLLMKLLEESELLLPDLHHAVELYQKEGEEKIFIIRTLEIIAWLATLFTLLLEVIFIFQPMASSIKELFQRATWQHHELEQQIMIRTLSLQQSNERLSHLASHDPLTGLKNRLYLEDDLGRLMFHYTINKLPYAVAMFDIDFFKKINDTYGHDIGDFVLCEVAKLFTHSTRDNDTIYRSGGEEFVIIFNRIKPEDVLSRCDFIRTHIEKHTFIFKDTHLHVTVSGGVFYPEIAPVEHVREVLKFADNALYRAKNEGRNRIVVAHQ